MKYYFIRDTAGRLLQMIDYTATQAKTYNYILDVHGSVIGLADERGTVISYEYDAWGNLLNTPDETVLTGNGEKLAEANPFRYSSYQYDRESGYYYLKYRYYSPFTGRFMSMDPVVSYNRYMYCGNNPVNYVDPLGLLQLGIGEDDEILKSLPRSAKVVSSSGFKIIHNNNKNLRGNREEIKSGEARVTSIGNNFGKDETWIESKNYQTIVRRYRRGSLEQTLDLLTREAFISFILFAVAGVAGVATGWGLIASAVVIPMVSNRIGNVLLSTDNVALPGEYYEITTSFFNENGLVKQYTTTIGPSGSRYNGTKWDFPY